MKNNILFVGNQGAENVLDFYTGVSNSLKERKENNIKTFCTHWLEDESEYLLDKHWYANNIFSFENWVKRNDLDYEKEVERINSDYKDTDWSLVIAAERSFTDYSMLLGTIGERNESAEYVIELMCNLITFYEHVITENRISGIVAQTADTIISFTAMKVAQHLGVSLHVISPAWLLEPNTEGGFYTYDEFMHCHAMEENYKSRQSTVLTENEKHRVDQLIGKICNFDGTTDFNKKHGWVTTTQILSPNIKNPIDFLVKNHRVDKNIVYTKIDFFEKIKANFLRFYRFYSTKKYFLGTGLSNIPEKSIFYALHMQPEQSTLAQGIWHVNQVSLVENISKSLPLGYTLIVKEHPAGQGKRPAWQYKHMKNLHNVIFCNADSKEIVKKVKAVISVSGTIALESLVLGKPTVVLGKNFFDYSDLFFVVNNIQDLPSVLRDILISDVYSKIPDIKKKLYVFLISYLDGLVPAYPFPEHGDVWADYLISDLFCMNRDHKDETNLYAPPKNSKLNIVLDN